MSKIAVVRTGCEIPDERSLEGARAFLFNALSGFSNQDKKAWNRLWRRMLKLDPGEIIQFDVVFPRSGPFHRRHMLIEHTVFNAQDRFGSFEQFRNWTKIGAGWVNWVPGAKGGIVPIPKSISYAAADDDEFHQYHEQVMAFLRGPHAAPYLWKHLGDDAHEMMETILERFDE